MKLSKKLRYGGYATLMVVLAIAGVVVVTMFVDQVPLKLDLTRHQVYSLSRQTTDVLDGLASDVTITTVAAGGRQDLSMQEILRRYALRSKHIRLQIVDPDRDPGWSKQYVKPGGFLRDGAIVVATPTRFKVIDPYDLRMTSVDMNDPNAVAEVISFSAERLLTSALLSVTAERDLVVYVVQGHGETNLGTLGLTNVAGQENYQVRYVNLMTVDAVPADADMVLVLGPTMDLPSADAEKLRGYLEGGGRAMLLLDIPTVAGSRPVTAGLLASFGVAMRNLLVVEGDAGRMAVNNPLYLLPKEEYHDITEPLSEAALPLIIPTSQAIETLVSRKQSLTIEKLLTSSENSWGKEHYQDLATLARADQDPAGPFTLAVAITQAAADPSRKDAKLIVVGSALFLAAQFAQQMPGNSEFFLNAMGWLGEKKASMSIRPKDLSTARLRLNAGTSYVLAAIVVILMPLVVLGFGLAVWLRRRHL